MDDETREEFRNISRYFELAQGQHVDLVARGDAIAAEQKEMRAEQKEMRDEQKEMRAVQKELRDELLASRADFRSFRDWVTAKFAEIGKQLRDIVTRLDRLESRNLT
jgi:predicted  nucleic acid-binding Zn-ribbon protein